ncbi:MAG: DUF3500 domain-containing protein [Verrucomicrobiales bacterium]
MAKWSVFLLMGLTPAVGRAHDAAADMAEAAQAFLAGLEDEKRAKATFVLGAEVREDWHFIPKDTRPGLLLKEMDAAQRHLAYALLGSGLGNDGFVKATLIMSLEQILRDIEQAPDRRDPEKYYFSIFGKPEAAGTWGWRCEGHHCSVNFTVVNGRLSGTPNFLGANPGEVRTGPRAGLRVLAEEEEAGRTLVKHLNDDQKKVAILPGDAPSDILTSAQRTIEPLTPAGLAAGTMTAEQRALLRDIISVYLNRARPELAAAEWKQIEDAGFDAIHFVWMGGLDRGQPHYYRVQGPTFLLEYDNTQNQANHPHAVWREFKGDFGRDFLAEHLKKDH